MFASLMPAAQDLKTTVISTLAKRPCLGARELHGHVLRDCSYAVSYQAVHKALNHLFAQNVLQKKGARYLLSKEWLYSVKEFLCDLEDAYINQRPASLVELPEYGSATVHNNGPLAEPYVWMLEQACKLRPLGKLDAVCFQRRAWPLLVFAGRHYNRVKNTFNDREQYVLVAGDKAMDKYFSTVWREAGFKCKLGVPCTGESETLVCGDFVFQVFSSEKTRKEWDKFYGCLANGSAQGLLSAYRLAFETTKQSRMVVTRNAEFAEKMRVEARSHFGKTQRL